MCSVILQKKIPYQILKEFGSCQQFNKTSGYPLAEHGLKTIPQEYTDY